MPASRVEQRPRPTRAQPLSSTSVSLVEANAWPRPLELGAQLAVVVDAAVEDDASPSSASRIGWRAAPDRSMIASRRCTSPARAVQPQARRRPGPRGASTAPIRSSASRSARPPGRSSAPKPHTAQAACSARAAPACRRAPRTARSAPRDGRRASRRATARRARSAPPASSMPSIVPSGAHATRARPAPSRSTAWWWNEFTASASPPTTAASREPGRDPRRRGSADAARIAWRWSTSRPTTSGRCWCSVPPRATFSACAPRQMPSIGIPRARRGGRRRARTGRARARPARARRAGSAS